ncbi:tRNA pseudouridine(55) synthase TruB [Mumia zhuanghuii]|uniref:tRNA pseudouridine synthase B n=2 Tax=Mumia TaxID=1546255 RepID=A0ABW1QS59_9ACTN|nr:MULTISPECIES: tRNA pseudouridine(55) synthase TruB [Mumia]KAA1420582.1 tRNA pseudouridine(55) synthase TruB [Mumia zhuanghuii]
MSTADAPTGIVVVDKPAGWTSHDVVGRMRRLAGTRKVGHAGTLDPMATGILVLGLGRATRLLGHVAGHDKDYEATIRLGATTVTDDAEGDVLTTSDASGVDLDAVRTATLPLIGEIDQVPSAVSAIKVDGRRAYARVRDGEDVTLPARRVTVERFDVFDLRSGPDGTVDVDARVTCSSGTYVRALARDVGAALGVGGHLAALRRTRVGGFTLDAARTLDQLAEELAVISLEDAARAAFPSVDLDADAAKIVRHGRALASYDLGAPGPVALFDPDGTFLALYDQQGADARSVAVFVG